MLGFTMAIDLSDSRTQACDVRISEYTFVPSINLKCDIVNQICTIFIVLMKQYQPLESIK